MYTGIQVRISQFILAAGVFAFSQSALAEGNSGNFNIGSITSVVNLLDLVIVPQAAENLHTEACATSNEYTVKWDVEEQEQIRAMQADLSAAFLNGEQVNLALAGCVEGRSKIVSVTRVTS